MRDVCVTGLHILVIWFPLNKARLPNHVIPPGQASVNKCYGLWVRS